MSAPAKKFRIGYLTSTIWTNDGSNSKYFTVDITRTYKDGEELKNTPSLGHADIANARELLRLAGDWIMTQ